MSTLRGRAIQVKLGWVTPGAEQYITDTARTSNPANIGKDGAKLVNFLIENKHWSPFEHSSASFKIWTSRAISQQIIRHRSFAFQEWSQRYAEAPGIEPVELRRQAKKNRQSSTDLVTGWWPRLLVWLGFRVSGWTYQRLLKAGVARECARAVLPLNTSTVIVMTGSIRSWIHYFELRCDEHTQLEHREIALAIRAILAEDLPAIGEALGW